MAKVGKVGEKDFLNGCSKEWNLDPGTGKRDREMERIRVINLS